MTDLVVLGAVLTVAGLAATLWRRRDGRLVAARGALDADTRARVGAPSGKPVLLLFTTPTCGSCDAAREVLAHVASERPTVTVAEVDVASEPAAARAHQVLRAPTVLLIDADDEVRARVSGVPDRHALVAALSA